MMRKVTFEMWIDEAVYAHGAIQSSLERTKRRYNELKAEGRDELQVHELAIEIYERAEKTFAEALNQKPDNG